MKRTISFICVGLALWGCSDGGGYKGDESAIREKTRSYVQAYNRQDAEALASYWNEDAEYTNIATGRIVKGRDAIREEFESIFDEDGKATLSVVIHSVTFPEKNRAIESGKATVKLPGKDPKESYYRVVYVREDGEWYLSSESEIETVEPSTHYQHLKQLDWLIGKWEDKDEDIQVSSQYKWDKYKNFITHTFQVKIFGKEEIEGKRIIGWDPAGEHIRSWMFDSLGGFAEGKWSKVGEKWVVETKSTLPDGGLGSQIHVMIPDGEDAFTYEISGRTVDGMILPNLGPITVERKRR